MSERDHGTQDSFRLERSAGAPVTRDARRTPPRSNLAARFIALEKRIVFDGAGAAHAEATLHADPVPHAVGDPMAAGDPSRAIAAPDKTASALPVEAKASQGPDAGNSLDALGAHLAAAFGPEPVPSHEIVFIDSSVPDVADLLKSIPQGADVVMVDPGKDGVDQIAAALRGQTDISAIHIISHGTQANLQIGTADLNVATMTTRYADDLATIRSALAPDADILVYGCDFAKGSDGDAAAHTLASATGANVAASTDLTGSADRGGNFVLEDRIGTLHTAALAPTDYDGLLTTPQATVLTTGGTGQFHQNLELLTFGSLTNGLPSGSGVVATVDYALANGGTLTATFSNVSYPTSGAAHTYAPTAVFNSSNLDQGYSSSSPAPLDALTATFVGTGYLTVSFTATTKDGVVYTPNIAFLDAELTDQTEAFVVTTTGGAFQNVESVGPTPSQYTLTGVGTTSISLTNAYDYQTQTLKGAPILVSTGAASFTIATSINGGFQAFALAVVDPVVSLDTDGSSGAGTGAYQTTFTEKGAAVSIGDSDTAVTEPGVTNAAGAKIVLTNAQAGDALGVGTLPAGISSSIDTSVAGQITVTLSGSASLDSYRTAIKGVTFANGSGDPSTVDRVLNVTVNDGTIDSTAAVSTIHVTAVNDAPVETAPSALSVVKNTASAAIGLSVADVDAEGSTETVTLSVAHGTLSLVSTSGLSFSAGTGTNDASETFSGTLANINAALAGLVYRPTADYVGTDSLTFTTTDNGNTGSGGALTATKTTAITVEAPTTVFADSGTGAYKANLEFLTFADTSLATSGLVNGATATYTTSDGGTVTATFSNVNYPAYASPFMPASIASYGWLNQGYRSSTSTTDALADQYNGIGSFTVTFTAVNKNGVAYSPNVAFMDAEITETMGESFGVTTNGGVFQNVETIGSTGYALNGIGTTSVTLQGTTGTGVPILVTDHATSLNIVSTIVGGLQMFSIALVRPTLDLDANDSSGKTGADYQTTFTEKGSAVAVADADAAVVEPGLSTVASATVVLGNAQSGDTLTVGTLPSGITGTVDTSVAGRITVTLSGAATLGSYQSALNAVRFGNSASNPSTVDRTISIHFNDGSIDSNTAISTVHVTAVNDAPVVTAPATQSTNKDTALAIGGLSVSDPDANGGAETVTLSVSHGTVSLAATAGLTFATGTGTSDTTVTFSGTVANLNAALATLTYRPVTAFSGSDALTVATNDNGNTGSGGALTTTKTIGLTVNGVDPGRVGTLSNRTYADGATNVSIQTAASFGNPLGLTLTYSATGLPAGLAIDAATGVISGALSHDASIQAPIATGSGATLDGHYTIVVTADDGKAVKRRRVSAWMRSTRRQS